MLVLGITDGITCGAAAVRDGTILAAINDERISRFKMAYGFPRLSIAAVLRLSGTQPEAVDLVTVATKNNHFFQKLSNNLLKSSNNARYYLYYILEDNNKYA